MMAMRMFIKLVFALLLIDSPLVTQNDAFKVGQSLPVNFINQSPLSILNGLTLFLL
uniref:Uncharacterized protein n=1 Tax=Tetranychus urticae TaxID=32264 RepID=T1KJX7_TETUR